MSRHGPPPGTWHGRLTGQRQRAHSPTKLRKTTKAAVSQVDWNGWLLFSFPSTSPTTGSSFSRLSISAGGSQVPPAQHTGVSPEEPWALGPGRVQTSHSPAPAPFTPPLLSLSSTPLLAQPSGPGPDTGLDSPLPPPPTATSPDPDLPQSSLNQAGPNSGSTNYFLLPDPFHLRPWQSAPPFPGAARAQGRAGPVPCLPTAGAAGPQEAQASGPHSRAFSLFFNRPYKQLGTQWALDCCGLHE